MRSVEVPEYEIHEEVRLDPTRTALIIVDMQNDFVVYTQDTHDEGDRSGRSGHSTSGKARGVGR